MKTATSAARELHTRDEISSNFFARTFGMSRDQFNTSVRGRKMAIGNLGACPAENLLSWADLNRLIETAGRRLDLLKVCRDGSILPQSAYVRTRPGSKMGQIVPAALARALREGFSIILDDLQAFHSPVERFSDALAHEMGEIVTTNAYASWSPQKCFPTHWDEHDTFIIQTAGAKTWSVFHPRRPAPVRLDVQCDNDSQDLELAWEGVLRPGDVLYMPRGWWHHASSTGRGSIHLTFGFSSQTGLDVFRFISELACHDPRFRMDLARPENAVAGTSSFIADALRSFAQSIDDGELLSLFWRNHLAKLPLSSKHALPLSLDAELFGASDRRIRFAGPSRQIGLTQEGSAVRLEAGSRQWDLDAQSRPILERVLKEDTVLISSLIAEGQTQLNAADIQSLVFQLVTEGILVIDDEYVT